MSEKEPSTTTMPASTTDTPWDWAGVVAKRAEPAGVPGTRPAITGGPSITAHTLMSITTNKTNPTKNSVVAALVSGTSCASTSNSSVTR